MGARKLKIQQLQKQLALTQNIAKVWMEKTEQLTEENEQRKELPESYRLKRQNDGLNGHKSYNGLLNAIHSWSTDYLPTKIKGAQ